MTVVYVTNLSFPDGAMASGNRVVHLARCLARHGVKVVVLSPFSDSGRPECFERDGLVFMSFCHVRESRWMRLFCSCIVFPLKATIAICHLRAKEAMLYSYTGNLVQEVWACLLAKVLKMPICREGCELPYAVISHQPRFAQWVEAEWVLRQYVGIVAMTEPLVAYYRSKTRLDCEIVHIPMTVDCSRFEDKLTRPFDFDYVAYTGAMGRLGGGVDVVVKAFGLLAERFPALHLVLVGNGTLAQEQAFENLLPLSAQPRLHCLFSGKIPAEEMPCYVAHAKVLVSVPVQTIQQEGCFPTKLGEYLASGVPIVLSRVGNPYRMLQSCKWVRFVDPGDAKATAAGIADVLLDYPKARQMAEMGRKFARVHFHYENFADSLYSWYEAVQRKG